MVVVQRNEMGRYRKLCVLTGLLSVSVLIWIFATYSARSGSERSMSIVVVVLASLAAVFSFFLLHSYPKRSQAVIFQREAAMVMATNALHEGYKLRFLRDILGENVVAFSDEERARWKSLEADGFFAALNVRNVRKVVLLRLCTMIFDDVFVADQYGRWEHHDASSTSEPAFSKRGVPPFKHWKDVSDHSKPAA
jgi:heme/copper-type cytochrome/quinol oxidase subunit 3